MTHQDVTPGVAYSSWGERVPSASVSDEHAPSDGSASGTAPSAPARPQDENRRRTGDAAWDRPIDTPSAPNRATMPLDGIAAENPSPSGTKRRASAPTRASDDDHRGSTPPTRSSGSVGGRAQEIRTLVGRSRG